MYSSTPADVPDPPFRFFEGLVPRLKYEYGYYCFVRSRACLKSEPVPCALCSPHPPPPLPEILIFSMVIIVLSQVLNNNLVPDCVKAIWEGLNSKFSRGRHAPSSHAHVSALSHATVILLPSCSLPLPNSYETLVYAHISCYTGGALASCNIARLREMNITWLTNEPHLEIVSYTITWHYNFVSLQRWHKHFWSSGSY